MTPPWSLRRRAGLRLPASLVCGAAAQLLLFFALVLTQSTLSVAGLASSGGLPANCSTPPLPSSSDPAARSCPAWLDDYISWHRQARSAPDSKFLVWRCNKGQEVTCGGLGDRLRGIMWTLRVAVASRRVLLINQASPMPMEVRGCVEVGAVDVDVEVHHVMMCGTKAVHFSGGLQQHVRAHMCARARACACACVRVRVCTHVWPPSLMYGA